MYRESAYEQDITKSIEEGKKSMPTKYTMTDKDYHAEITATSGPVVVRDVTRAPYWGPRGARCNLLLNPLR